MIYLHAALSQHFAPDALPAAVRATLGKPLRRAAALTQLAIFGALAAIPPKRRNWPTALLWQTSSGPRAATLALLDKVCKGPAEAMPYDFLASQPAIVAAQLKPFLPGLQAASCLPLADETTAHWSLLLSLAQHWLSTGRYAQVLCAQLDEHPEELSGYWLALGSAALENPAASLHLTKVQSQGSEPDTPDFPAHLSRWLSEGNSPILQLQSAAGQALAVEFART